MNMKNTYANEKVTVNKYHGTAYSECPPLLRVELGEVLRGLRLSQGRTLREVSSEAQVSLGYLSEVERGQKEASSELLQSISQALSVPLWWVLREVSDRMSLLRSVPDMVPDDLLQVPIA